MARISPEKSKSCRFPIDSLNPASHNISSSFNPDADRRRIVAPQRRNRQPLQPGDTRVKISKTAGLLLNVIKLREQSNGKDSEIDKQSSRCLFHLFLSNTKKQNAVCQ